jgi:hypothetical protein
LVRLNNCVFLDWERHAPTEIDGGVDFMRCPQKSEGTAYRDSNPVMSPDGLDYLASAGNQMPDAMMRDCPCSTPVTHLCGLPICQLGWQIQNHLSATRYSVMPTAIFDGGLI